MTLFILAYALVMAEEQLHMRKSKPVLVAAGLIWTLIGWVYVQAGLPNEAEEAFRDTLLEYSELLLFLLVAMTYINALEERRVFDALRSWMVRKGFSYRSLFWITGILAFCISAIANNLTTAMLMCAVVLKVAEGDKRTRYTQRGEWKKLEQLGSVVPFDVFTRIARSEWDTLLFFYGVVMCVGGLGFMGYLSLLSHTLYAGWDPVWANVVLGLVSAVGG